MVGIKSARILITEDEIKNYIGISSRSLFESLLKNGMPIGVFQGRYYAHTENLDDWFKQQTISKVDNIDPEVE